MGILRHLHALHCHPHPYFTVLPSESDLTFWEILMEGPPDTPYEKGVFELFCQFGDDYPVKPPLVRFVTRMYHCNINSVGRICHNIFDRNYKAQITMRDIFDAVYGLLIIPEPEDTLDSILAEEYLTSRETYDQEAKNHTAKTAGQSLDDMEKKLVELVEEFVPERLCCSITKKVFVDPVKTKYGTVYERKAIEKHLKLLPEKVVYMKRPTDLDISWRGGDGAGNTLESCGISEETTVHFSLSSFAEEVPDNKEFFSDDVEPSVQQTPKGMGVFFSSLYVIKHKPQVVSHKNLIGYIRKLTGCNPLAQSLYQLLIKNEFLSRTQKIAVVEGLYTLFRELLPKLGSKRGEKIIEDLDVFENSTYCWAFLMTEAKKETEDHEDYAPFSLMSEDNKRFCDPVTVPGVPGVLERAYVLQIINYGEKIPNCPEEVLQETSLRRATDIEKILLSVHPSVTTYYLWISHGSVTGQNFHIETFGDMAEELKALPLLNVTPPLLLKDLGCQEQCLVFLSKDNLGVHLQKNKLTPAVIEVYDCLAGKVQHVDVDELAAKTGDHRDDQSFVTTRTPKEAILVLIDTSKSMTWKCYESVEIQRIHAVKELFDNFATRTMAYDFHHVIGLVKFDFKVKTIGTFTETLEKFKELVRTLETSGGTRLYDALQHGILELENVKKTLSHRWM
ncbi:uncharacterized protein LOC133995955 [Scomber scombrus]|uniref:uncharacterized protein LOC133995955 n=1 Tax=Scomber scombrus TaxID=13677 RepID=UPI002DD83D70|nr:uncharacterized protein LOC133995955 [Scomber scombrus]